MADKTVLQAIRVLKLVHQQVSETAIVGLANLGQLIEQRNGLEQQVVEIERIGAAQLLGVASEYRSNPFVSGGRPLVINALGRQSSVLRVADAGQGGAGRGYLIPKSQLPNAGLDGRELRVCVVNGKIPADAQPADLPPQHADAEEPRIVER